MAKPPLGPVDDINFDQILRFFHLTRGDCASFSLKAKRIFDDREKPCAGFFFKGKSGKVSSFYISEDDFEYCGMSDKRRILTQFIYDECCKLNILDDVFDNAPRGFAVEGVAVDYFRDSDSRGGENCCVS